jgi:hypothetical protein
MSKQSPHKCFSSLVCQLCSQSEEVPSQLEDLYERCAQGQSPPTMQDLTSIIDSFTALTDVEDIYIVLDALDECPKLDVEDQRAELLDAIDTVQSIAHSNIHLLVTSRKEIGIQVCLTPRLTVPALSIQDAGVTADIRTYIRSQLASDPKLNSWSEDVKRDIERALSEGAGGMYDLILSWKDLNHADQVI